MTAARPSVRGDLAQRRELVTAIPGPRSVALHARRTVAVAAGVGSTLPVYVADADGGVIVDVDGNSLIDLGSGIAVSSVGNAAPAVVDGVRDAVGHFTHTCFMVTPYEGYVAVAEKLAELTPGRHAKRSALFNSGAEAVENAVKIARVATGRQAVVVFNHAYHGRTNLTMALTAKAMPYKKGFGPFAGEIYRVPMSYPFRDPAGLSGKLGPMSTMTELDLNAAARRIEVLALPRLHTLAAGTGRIGDVRGRGAMLALEFTVGGSLEPDPAAAAAAAAACHRAVVLTCGTFGNVIRLLPPLVIGSDLLAEGLSVLEDAVRGL